MEGARAARLFGLILLVLAGGFLATALEVRDLHRDAVEDEWIAWAPTVLSFAGTAACILLLGSSRVLRGIALAALALVALGGFVGLYQHTKFQWSRFAPLLASSEIVARANGDDDEGERRRERRRALEQEPPLAPLSITGLATIGILAGLGRRSH